MPCDILLLCDGMRRERPTDVTIVSPWIDRKLDEVLRYADVEHIFVHPHYIDFCMASRSSIFLLWVVTKDCLEGPLAISSTH